MATGRRGDRWWAKAYHSGGEREWVGTFDTQAEAEAAVQAALARGPERSRRETVAEFAGRWEDDYGLIEGKPRWAEGTRQNNGYAVKKLIEEWGTVRLDRLTADKRFGPWLRSCLPHDVKVFRSLFRDAVSDGLMDTDPTAGLKTEKGHGRRKIQAIDDDELGLLADTAFEAHGAGAFAEEMRALTIFQGTVGTRPIALRHLLVRDVDLEAGTVYLRHPGKGVAPRTVALFPATVAALRRLPARLDRDGYLFRTKTGKRVSKSSLFYAWNPVRVAFEAKLPPERAQELRDSRSDGAAMDLYELRHAAATSMRRHGATWEQIAHQLCQTDGGEQARKTYSHLTEVDHIGGLKALYGQNVTELRPVREAHGG